MEITVVSYKFSNGAVKYVKMFCLKFFEIHLNTIPEMVVFGVQGCILIELVYNKFVNQVMISCLNIKPLSKENF